MATRCGPSRGRCAERRATGGGAGEVCQERTAPSCCNRNRGNTMYGKGLGAPARSSLQLRWYAGMGVSWSEVCKEVCRLSVWSRHTRAVCTGSLHAGSTRYMYMYMTRYQHACTQYLYTTVGSSPTLPRGGTGHHLTCHVGCDVNQQAARGICCKPRSRPGGQSCGTRTRFGLRTP